MSIEIIGGAVYLERDVIDRNEYHISHAENRYPLLDIIKGSVKIERHYVIEHITKTTEGRIIERKVKGIAHNKKELAKKTRKLALGIAKNIANAVSRWNS